MVWGLEPVDLDWMLEKKVCRGDEVRRSKERRDARRLVVEERWETWLAEEKVVLLQKAMDATWWISRTRKTVDHVTMNTININGNNNKNNNQPPIQGRTDPEIHEQLKDLGLLVDVKNTLEEMDIENEHDEQEGEGGRREEGYKYWPMLRWMQMYHSTEYGRSREREVKRILMPLKE